MTRFQKYRVSIDCARNIENRMTISESDEFYPVVDFLQEFHDYMNDEIQYFDLSILHNKTSDLVYAMSVLRSH